MKTIFLSAALAAVAMAAPVQAAEGFGILLGGGGWRVPSCKEGKVLREVRSEATSKLIWRCVLPADQAAQATPAPQKTAQMVVPRQKPQQVAQGSRR
jgi:hypothetical protein